MVVVAQTYSPNWRAYVNGADTRVWRANHAFQAIQVPAGESRVDFVYREEGFRVGLALWAASLAVLLAMASRFRTRPRLPSAGSSPT
jgi:uncharacterized membrane protein YfhO